MTLYEIGCQYEESAKPLRTRLRELRTMLKEATDRDEIFNIKRRIHILTLMLTDCNKLARHCKQYYDKGYNINYGAFERYERSGKATAKQAAVGDHPTHIDKRIDTSATASCAGMSIQQADIRQLSGRTRRVQNDCFAKLLQRFE